jgi:hypothetical protein
MWQKSTNKHDNTITLHHCKLNVFNVAFGRIALALKRYGFCRFVLPWIQEPTLLICQRYA